MPRKGRSNDESIHALHQVEGGEKVAEVCRRLGVSEQTFCFNQNPGQSPLKGERNCANVWRRLVHSDHRPDKSQ
jgi:hypothetical protein